MKMDKKGGLIAYLFWISLGFFTGLFLYATFFCD